MKKIPYYMDIYIYIFSKVKKFDHKCLKKRVLMSLE